jgi:hypothetical protein
MYKKNNIYIINTEFHLMVAVNLSLTLYSDSDYFNIIYLIKSKNRLNKDINISTEINGKIVVVENANFIKEINQIVKLPCFRFYFFQENSIYNLWLAYRLSKTGAIIALGPDGTKPYGVFDKNHESLSMIKDTIKDYWKLMKANLFLPILVPSRYYIYGSSKIIDEIWLYNLEMFNSESNKTKAKLIKIPNFSPLVWNKLNNLFIFSINIIPKLDSILFYLNQPLWSEKLVDAEIDFLMQTSKLFSDKEILIKLHPITPKTTIERYMKISNVTLISSNVPAELFIASLTNSIVFSGWSAGLAINNSNCSLYYILDVFRKIDDIVLSQITINNFNHILLVSSPQQMIFPINK